MSHLRFPHIHSRFHDLLDDIVVAFRRKSRILMVVDQSVAVLATAGFGIGRVIDIMSNASFGCASFDVKLAARFGSQDKNNAAGLHDFTYTGFRFDQTEADGSFIIDHYDQIWCFGFDPGNDQPNNLDPAIDVNIASHPWAATNSELERLARWMNERQGGLFGTGDHHYLGASLCSRIPRLGVMRMWSVTDGVPTIGGTTRLDTNRPVSAAQQAGTAVIPNSVETDAKPQVIDWVAEYTWSTSPFFAYKSPHPILCHPTLGPINVMPDHPHEGRCFDPTDANWIATRRDATYNFNGYSGDQFPTVGGVRPLPKIIAWGDTLAGPPLQFAKGEQQARRFPMISVYDGQKIGIGRVVTDSTWHHWFNMNLDGLATEADTTEYEKIKRYYVNIGIWLASATWRKAMVWCPILTSRFEYFGLKERTLDMSLIDIGRMHIEYLWPRLGPCWVRDWIWEGLFEIDRDILKWLEEKIKPRPWPCLTCPPIELIEAAVMGGIIKSLFADERELNKRLSLVDKPRFELDPKEVEQRVRQGTVRGVLELAELYERSAKEAKSQIESLTRLIGKERSKGK
ncbi:MAG: hypothetical protein ACLGHO_12215 [Gammaproteobacteria bacterium]